MQFWQSFVGHAPEQRVWTDRYPATMPDGRRLLLPLD